MKFPVVRTVIATSSVIIYFKKRKLYVDDKFYQIKVLPSKTVKVYKKDVVNIIGIVGASTLCISIAEKAYCLAKNQIAKYDITFKVSKRLPPADAGNTSIVDPDMIDFTSPDSVEIVPLQDQTLQPKSSFPVRDIVWIAVAIALTYYLGQRIDGTSLNDVNPKDFSDESKIPILTTNLSWWEKLTLPDWMIKDISDEGTFGQITRPTITKTDIEPIANPRPRRIVVILFSILQQNPALNSTSKVPVWMYSPLFYLVQAVYRRFNN